MEYQYQVKTDTPEEVSDVTVDDTETETTEEA
jgi:hypothetical protein